jgi:hypothetical protein
MAPVAPAHGRRAINATRRAQTGPADSSDCGCGPVVTPAWRPGSHDGAPSGFDDRASECTRAGVIVFDAGGRLLLQQSYGNKWGVAKGAVRDHLESPRHAAARELREETGMDRDPDQLAPSATISIANTIYHFFELQATCTLCPTFAGAEVTALAWVCSRCCRDKLRDRRGQRGLDAVNLSSRLLLSHILNEGRNDLICQAWA